jgi:putative serine protease PepD
MSDTVPADEIPDGRIADSGGETTPPGAESPPIGPPGPATGAGPAAGDGVESQRWSRASGEQAARGVPADSPEAHVPGWHSSAPNWASDRDHVGTPPASSPVPEPRRGGMEPDPDDGAAPAGARAPQGVDPAGPTRPAGAAQPTVVPGEAAALDDPTATARPGGWQSGPYPAPGGWQQQAWQPPAGPSPYPPAEKAEGKGGRVRTLVAVAGVAAVVGGLIGGGTVALTRGDGSTVLPASVNRTSDTAQGTPTSESGTVEGAAATITPSVVTLTISGGSADGTGSGVVIRTDGYILTNDHVVSAASDGGTITATFSDGRTATAKIVGTDTSSDLAVVKVDGVSGLTAATFADSDKVRVGQSVVAVGSPLGLDKTVTAGIVSATHRATRGGDDNNAIFDAVQTDAPINPGNSGGPLVDLSGHVVGINAEIATAGSNGRVPGQSSGGGNIGIGFAIPSNTAAFIADQLVAKGSAQHAYLGVELSSGNGTTSGATIASVTSGGPASKAGLRQGDVITKFGDRQVTSADDLAAATRSEQPGDKVTLTLVRGGKASTVTVTLGADARQ